ncbi:MAG TPA: acyltransferase [Anaerolineae bacterium]|nr:acyltransferase [Anaerolineae bacterium]
MLSLIPGLGGMWLRRAWYRATLTHCGDNVYISFLSAIRTAKSSLGSDIDIGPGCWLGWVDVGDGVMFGGYNVVLSGTKQHGFSRTDVPMRLQEGQPIQVRIGRDVWVGSGAIIGADIAEGCLIGAGSVVVKPTEPYTIVAGVPGRVIRHRGASARRNAVD